MAYYNYSNRNSGSHGILYAAIVILIAIVIFAWVMSTPEGSKNYTNHTNLVKIENRDNLYYDPNERIVYIIFNEVSGYQGYGYMSPYYASNGLPYKYDPATRKLVEIEWPALPVEKEKS